MACVLFLDHCVDVTSSVSPTLTVRVMESEPHVLLFLFPGLSADSPVSVTQPDKEREHPVFTDLVLISRKEKDNVPFV